MSAGMSSHTSWKSNIQWDVQLLYIPTYQEVRIRPTKPTPKVDQRSGRMAGIAR